ADSIVELPGGVTALPDENFTVTNTWIRALGSDAKPEAGIPGYTVFPNDRDLLAEVRPLQPLRETKAQLPEADTLSIYRDKSPSGWYLSGWRDLSMTKKAGAGIDGGSALAVVAKGAKGGGATYRTKRVSSAIHFANYRETDWELRMSIRTADQALTGLEISAL